MIRRTFISICFFAFLILLWEILYLLELWSPVLLPAPTEVAIYIYGVLDNNTLPSAIFVTLKRIILGYGCGLILGLPLGLLCSRLNFFRDTLGLIALGLQTLPSVCWVPLALLWFGQTESAMFFIVIMGSLWSVIIAINTGVRQVPPIYAKAAKTMGSRKLHTWIYVFLPAALPFIVSGMKQGWAFAWRSLMAAEIYVTILTGFGLGHLLHYGRELNAMEQVVGIMGIILTIGLLVDKLCFSPIETILHRRWGTNLTN